MNYVKIVGSGILQFASNSVKKVSTVVNGSGSEMINLVRNAEGNLCFSGKFSFDSKAATTYTRDALDISTAKNQKVSDIKKVFHFFRRRFRTNREINDFSMDVLPHLKDEERFIGYLPKNWRNCFDKKDLGKKTQELNKIFSFFAKSISIKNQIIPDELLSHTQQLSNQLENFLGQKCEVSYLASGGFGRVFRIKCANEDLILKIFKANGKINSKLKEIANAASLNHLLKPNQRANFYCGKIPSDNSPNDSFMLMQFIEPNSKVKINKHRFFALDPLLYRRFDFSDDHSGNFINNILIDFGLIDLMYKNKAVQNFAKKLYPLIKKGDIESINRMKRIYQGNEDFCAAIRRVQQLLKVPTDYKYTSDQIKAINSLV